MASEKTKINKNNLKNLLCSIAWMIEAGFRGFIGWVLLSNFDHPVTYLAAIYALATCGWIVAKHFIDAKK